MAAGFYYQTDITVIDTTTTTSANTYSYHIVHEPETKEEKIKRIAKERLLSSHKTYNQKTPTVREIKRICKPIHRIHLHRR